jgi:hypothetical protein
MLHSSTYLCTKYAHPLDFCSWKTGPLRSLGWFARWRDRKNRLTSPWTGREINKLNQSNTKMNHRYHIENKNATLLTLLVESLCLEFIFPLNTRTELRIICRCIVTLKSICSLCCSTIFDRINKRYDIPTNLLLKPRNSDALIRKLSWSSVDEKFVHKKSTDVCLKVTMNIRWRFPETKEWNGKRILVAQ